MSIKVIDINFELNSIQLHLLENLINKHTFTASNNLSECVESTNSKTHKKAQKTTKN